jgi:hypothetical protein
MPHGSVYGRRCDRARLLAGPATGLQLPLPEPHLFFYLALAIRDFLIFLLENELALFIKLQKMGRKLLYESTYFKPCHLTPDLKIELGVGFRIST